MRIKGEDKYQSHKEEFIQETENEWNVPSSRSTWKTLARYTLHTHTKNNSWIDLELWQ